MLVNKQLQRKIRRRYDFETGDFNRVGECLYRIHTGGYYALIKVRGKQIKRPSGPTTQSPRKTSPERNARKGRRVDSIGKKSTSKPSQSGVSIVLQWQSQ